MMKWGGASAFLVSKMNGSCVTLPVSSAGEREGSDEPASPRQAPKLKVAGSFFFAFFRLLRSDALTHLLHLMSARDCRSAELAHVATKLHTETGGVLGSRSSQVVHSCSTLEMVRAVQEGKDCNKGATRKVKVHLRAVDLELVFLS